MPEVVLVEKRATKRFHVDLPMSYRSSNASSDIRSHTRDVSARGVSFFCGSALPEGSTIYLTLTLPAQVTGTESIKMRCIGRVVRVDNSGLKRGVSIAAVIDRYEFLGDR